jgi:hypothetical protein
VVARADFLEIDANVDAAPGGVAEVHPERSLYGLGLGFSV